MICCRCNKEGADMHCSRTDYTWDGTGPDPNADIPLCPDCAVDHHAFWDEMWAEYYSHIL